MTFSDPPCPFVTLTCNIMLLIGNKKKKNQEPADI